MEVVLICVFGVTVFIFSYWHPLKSKRSAPYRPKPDGKRDHSDKDYYSENS